MLDYYLYMEQIKKKHHELFATKLNSYIHQTVEFFSNRLEKMCSGRFVAVKHDDRLYHQLYPMFSLSRTLYDDECP